MGRPLLVSDDATLIDDVLRLAAAANVELHLATEPESARGPWSRAPLVLVGTDAAGRMAGLRPERRRDVVLVGRQMSDADWQRAVTLGAEHVACLPDSERWLIDRIADSGEGPLRHGVVVGVVSAGGGAGASTVAVTLAGLAAQTSRVLLVDLDPLAGGVDVLIGREGAPGTRWGDLAGTRGRLSPQTLEQALPEWSGACVLSWGREGTVRLTPDAVASVLDAGERAFDVVVLDLPRALDDVTDLALGRAQRTLLVTAACVRGVAAAARIGEALRERSSSLGVVVRRQPRGVSLEAVASVLTDPVLGAVPYSSSLARRCDAGDGPALRDGYARAVRRLLPDVVALPTASSSSSVTSVSGRSA